jgi:hypothetical protein
MPEFKEPVVLLNSAGQETMRLEGSVGKLSLGRNGQDGDVIVNDAEGRQTIHLNGAEGNIYLGGGGQDGDVVVHDAQGRETIRLNGSEGNIYLGGEGQDGDVVVRDARGRETIRLNGEAGEIRIRNWTISVPDYVFASNHPLTSLDSVKQYVQRHHHLPGMPSATEIARVGIPLGETNMKLLEKIEELFLHVIRLDAECGRLDEQLARIRQVTPT